MFEVSTILEDDSAELVSGGANGLIFVLMFGEVLGEGASLSIEVEEEEDASAVSGRGKVAAEVGLDAVKTRRGVE
nr:hypothetical protein [Tanacetum cinerariifolium]